MSAPSPIPQSSANSHRSSLDLATTSSSRSGNSSNESRKQFRARSEPLLKYTIDLSKPPHQRYNAICADFREELAEFSALYSAVLDLSGFRRTAGFLALFLLRRVHSKEETREIEGISRASGLKLNEVVAYNSFLDMFSGCMSGGVRASGADGEDERMLHFRNLDWEKEALRDLLIEVEYVREGKVIARGVTYAGYVGTLTGVREGLSISMNYRLRLNSSSRTISHRRHQLAILLGLRPSIASQLRTLLLSPGPPPALLDIRQYFKSNLASPCYLTFCSPDEVLVLEKDLKGLASEAQTSKSFLAVTNHDRGMEGWPKERWKQILRQQRGMDNSNTLALHGIMDDSMERKACLVQLWGHKTQGDADGVEGRCARVEEIQEWLRTPPVRNNTTHFSCIMDPSRQGGGLLWVEACEEA